MRFLILKHKSVPDILINNIKYMAKQYGHELIDWRKELVYMKDFDRILAFPETDSEISEALNAWYDGGQIGLEDSEFSSITAGRGIYEGCFFHKTRANCVLHDYVNGTFRTLCMEPDQFDKFDDDDFLAWGNIWFKREGKTLETLFTENQGLIESPKKLLLL